MEPIFTMQYGEFAVADYLSKKIRGASVFIPASSQEKGIDLLPYRFDGGRNTTNSIQVKMSRTYYSGNKDASFPYGLWFNRFPIHNNANWYILVGVFAKRPDDLESARMNRAKCDSWDTIMLAFTNKEMNSFMATLKQKKDPTKEDRMFGFGFDDNKNIFQTRGFTEPRDMRPFLIENRLNEICNSFV